MKLIVAEAILGLPRLGGELIFSIEDEEQLKLKLDLVENTFTAIRDHAGIDQWTRGEAEFGERKVVDLRIFLRDLSERAVRRS